MLGVRIRRAGRLACAAIAVGLIAASCGSDGGGGGGAADASSPFVLGGQFDLSGIARAASTPASKGLQAAVDGVNRRGGVDGRKIELVIRDDGSNTARITSVYRELVTSSNASAIAGLVSSQQTPVVVPLAERDKMALIDAGTPGSFIQPPNPSVFSSSANQNLQGPAQLAYIMSLAGQRKVPAKPRVAAIYYATPSSTEALEATKAYAAEVGIDLVTVESPPVGQGAMGPVMSAIRSANVDAIVSGLIPTDVIAAVKVAATSGLDMSMPWANYSFGGGPEVLKEIAGLGHTGYAVLATVNILGDTPGSKTFLEDLKANGVDPMEQGVEVGYIQGIIAAEVFAKCGFPCAPEKFRSTIATFSSSLDDLAFGPVAYSDQDHSGIGVVKFAKWDAATGNLTYAGDAVKLEVKV